MVLFRWLWCRAGSICECAHVCVRPCPCIFVRAGVHVCVEQTPLTGLVSCPALSSSSEVVAGEGTCPRPLGSVSPGMAGHPASSLVPQTLVMVPSAGLAQVKQTLAKAGTQ